MPSLSSGRRRHEVAEGLLVAEHESLIGVVEHRPGDPLEPGEGLGVVHAVRRRHLAEERRRHERRDDESVVARCRRQDVIGEQPAELVTAEATPPTLGRRDGGAEPIRIGIVGERDVGVDGGGQLEQEIHRARFLGVRERHGRKRRIGLELRVDDVGCRQAGALERGEQHSPPTPCIGV